MPMMTDSEKAFLASHLREKFRVWEWGSGASSRWLAERCLFVTSVEHDRGWAVEVINRLRDNQALLFFQPGPSFLGPPNDGTYDDFRDYVDSYTGQNIDLVLIDGRARVACARRVAEVASNSTQNILIFLHDCDREEYAPIWEKYFQEISRVDNLMLLKRRPQEHTSISIPQNQREEQKNTCIEQPSSIRGSAEEYECVFLNTYYPAFIDSHFRKHPYLLSASYREQKDSLQASFFGDSDFYSEGLKKAGWDAEDLIINCSLLQQAWARENNFHDYSDILEIAVEQIRQAKPDVIYFQDLSTATRDFLTAVRPYTKLIAGQIASPVPGQADLHSFDIIFSSFPHFVDRFRQMGITSYYQPLAFDPRVLDKLPPSAREYQVTFTGGISMAHGERKDFLEMISEQVQIDFWGYGVELLPDYCSLKNRYHGEAWGLQMFYVLHRSFITINNHINVAENNANNMRLFEATGCGALLITDYKDNLNELFEIGKEVVAYRSPEECAALIKYYLANPKEADVIARAGQARTLRDHTYTKRMEQTAEILGRHLRYQRERDIFSAPDMSNISHGHMPIQQSEITNKMTSAWQSEEIPAKQRALVQQELEGMYKGKIPQVYQVLADSLRPYVRPGCSILEIGCASGYYYEILEYLLNMKLDYTGVDYSEPLISMAKDYYPRAIFFTADGADLPFSDNQFDIVISSCILLHTPDYRKHISETARVAKRYVVAHRTPICRRRPTQYFKKFAYGVETVELRFNEKELLSEFTQNKLKPIGYFEYHSNINIDEFDVTYLFRK